MKYALIIPFIILLACLSVSLATSFVLWDWQWFWETNTGFRILVLLAVTGGGASR